MAKPLARVLMLLDILQAGGIRTLRELAERLGVDEGTVRRYVDHLLDLGVPVESVRGRYGGYRLAPGYRLPPLMLTDDEALAVLLGLLAARRSGTAARLPRGVARGGAPTATAVAANAPCGPTASSPTPRGGTSPARTRRAARCGCSGSTASPRRQ